MPLPPVPETAGEQTVPGDLAQAGVYPTADAGFARGLVVLAMGEAYWLVPGESGFCLLVEPAVAASVQEQLARYERESIGWPPAPVDEGAPAGPDDQISPLLWALALAGVFWLQSVRPAIVEAGLLDAAGVFSQGEVWRAATALFLHADAAHLLANAISGWFIFAAWLGVVGPARGWWWIAVSAIAGNLVVAALHHPEAYRSMGASTAVFAGLGLLTGRAASLAWSDGGGKPLASVLAPLGSGGALLALYGAGGLPIDVSAHAAGFGAGLAAGLVVGWIDRKKVQQG